MIVPLALFLKKNRKECVIFVIRLGRERNFYYICGGKAETVSPAQEAMKAGLRDDVFNNWKVR